MSHVALRSFVDHHVCLELGRRSAPTRRGDVRQASFSTLSSRSLHLRRSRIRWIRERRDGKIQATFSANLAGQGARRAQLGYAGQQASRDKRNLLEDHTRWMPKRRKKVVTSVRDCGEAETERRLVKGKGVHV